VLLAVCLSNSWPDCALRIPQLPASPHLGSPRYFKTLVKEAIAYTLYMSANTFLPNGVAALVLLVSESGTHSASTGINEVLNDGFWSMIKRTAVSVGLSVLKYLNSVWLLLMQADDQQCYSMVSPYLCWSQTLPAVCLPACLPAWCAVRWPAGPGREHVPWCPGVIHAVPVLTQLRIPGESRGGRWHAGGGA
jgi:hypothetical protein